MTEADFWALIDRSRDAAGGDPEAQLATLQTAVGALDADEIVSFDRAFSSAHRAAYAWPLWGAAYVIGGGCGDDGFSDFRGWLISRGKNVYDAVLADPDSLADLADELDFGPEENGQVEGFRYVAFAAWAAKTGRPPAEMPAHGLPPEDEPAGDAWDEPADGSGGDLARRFPKLTALTDEG